jgi:TonB family protein
MKSYDNAELKQVMGVSVDDGHPLAFCSETEDDKSPEWLLSDRGLSAGNFLVGLGGAILLHLVVMLLALISPLMYARTTPLGSCMTVSLLDPATIGNSGGASQRPHEPWAEARSGAHEGGASPACDLLDLVPERDPENSPKPEVASPDADNAEPEPVRSLDISHSSQQVAKVVAIDKSTKRPIIPPGGKPAPQRATKRASARSQNSLAESRPASSNASPEVIPKSEHDTGGGTSGVPGGIGGEGPGTGTVRSGVPSGESAFPAEFNVNQVDISPELVEKVEPAYPFIARRNGISGKVRVKLLVGIDGRVIRPSIVEAEPKGVFEQTVLEAIQKWKFKPGIYRGRPVATWVILPVQFRLAR